MKLININKTFYLSPSCMSIHRGNDRRPMGGHNIHRIITQRPNVLLENSCLNGN